MASISNTGGNSFLDASYHTKTPAELKAVYNAWAEKYDADIVDGQGYRAPVVAAQGLTTVLAASPTLKVLDCGCGTGLVGAALKTLGYPLIDGIDLSEGMLAQAAKTGAYSSLKAADLMEPIDAKDASYDGLICVGTLTHGHVGPHVLDEFVRVTKKNGFIVATVVHDIYESIYQKPVEALVHAQKVRLLSAETAPYRTGPGVAARLIILQVL